MSGAGILPAFFIPTHREKTAGETPALQNLSHIFCVISIREY
jgi:hypothetical protein